MRVEVDQYFSEYPLTQYTKLIMTPKILKTNYIATHKTFDFYVLKYSENYFVSEL